MKSDRVKKTLLVILIIVAGIIWIRNLNIFKGGGEHYEIRSSTVKSKSMDKQEISRIEYKKPRLNPFVPASRNQKTDQTTEDKKKTAPPAPPRISERYRIDGIVIESGSSQAVLTSANGPGIVLSASDTLEGWSVENISHNLVIFSQGKLKDTLHLQPVESD